MRDGELRTLAPLDDLIRRSPVLSPESRLRWPDRAAMATRPAGRSGRAVRGAPGRTTLNLADSQSLLARSGVRVGLISGGLRGSTQVSAGEHRDRATREYSGRASAGLAGDDGSRCSCWPTALTPRLSSPGSLPALPRRPSC